jgi:hypothetical protein
MEKTQKWLADAGHADADPEWFLAMWSTQQEYELGWTDRAEMLQHRIANPPTYADLEAEFFGFIEECGREGADDFTTMFFGD